MLKQRQTKDVSFADKYCSTLTSCFLRKFLNASVLMDSWCTLTTNSNFLSDLVSYPIKKKPKNPQKATTKKTLKTSRPTTFLKGGYLFRLNNYWQTPSPVCWNIGPTQYKINHCLLPRSESLLSKPKQTLLLNSMLKNDRVWPVVRLQCSVPCSSLLSGHSLSSPGSWFFPQACKTTDTAMQCVIMWLESTSLSPPASPDTVFRDTLVITKC